MNLGFKIPIIQAPMAGVDSIELAVAVSEAGGLGSLACALLSPEQIRQAWGAIRQQTSAPMNLNFFCHQQEADSPIQQQKWKDRLAPYYQELDLDIEKVMPSPTRAPFDEKFCRVIEEIKPEFVSFHFGLPAEDLLNRVRQTGATIMSSATTIDEAIWLQQNGADVIIAQGVEAGGHRAMFLSHDVSQQPPLHDLLAGILQHVTLPVVAAGGIADAKGIKEALSMGAVAVQLGTAYLFCPEAKVSDMYRKALKTDDLTVLTNVFSGRPARGIMNRLVNEVGPLSDDAPEFPYASTFIQPLRQASEKAGLTDFMQLWSGTYRVPHTMDARTLTETLYEQAMAAE